jgi:hypothetical protein
MGNHPREAPPPSRYGKSKNGIYFYLVHTTKRDEKGQKLYRCKYAEGVTGRWWTLPELEGAGVRWLQRRPSAL